MMGLTFDVDKDHVILVFGKRGKTLPLTVQMSDQIEALLNQMADVAQAWADGGGTRKVVSESCSIAVQGRDSKVYLTFERPVDRYSMPYQAARELATQIHSTVQEVLGFESRKNAIMRNGQ